MRIAEMTAGVLLILAAGCASLVVIPPPPEADRILKRPDRLLNRVQEEQGHLRDLRGVVEIVLNAREERYAGKAVLLLRGDGSIRLEPLNFFGQPLIYIVADNDTLSAYHPSKNQYFRGRATARNLYRWLGIPLTPREVVEVLLGSVVPRQEAGDVRVRWDGTVGQSGAYQLQITEGDRVRRQWWLDARSLVPLRFQSIAHSGGAGLEVFYSGYRTEDGLRFPASVEVEVGRGERTLEIHYRRVKLNQGLTPLAFHLPVPSGVSVIPLDRE